MSEEIRATAAGAYVEESPPGQARATAAGAYIEETWDPQTRATLVGVYVELAYRPQVLRYRLLVDWDQDGIYTDESESLIDASGSSRFHPPGSQIAAGAGIVDGCTVRLHNRAGRYSPLRTDGALYASLAGGGAYHAPMQLDVSRDNGNTWTRVFTGVIKTPTESGLTSRSAATVELTCRGRDELLLQQRASSPLADFVAVAEGGETESQIIARWLTLSGLTDGVDFVSQAYALANSVTATLDPGLFAIRWAWLDDESPLEEMWRLAAACGGRLYCDPLGVWRYENAAHWLLSPHPESVATLTKGDFGRLAPRYEDSELFQSVSVEVAPRAVLESGDLWAADEVLVIPAGESIEVIAPLRQPAYAIEGVEMIAVTGGGSNISGNVSVDSRTDYAQRVVMEIVNSHTSQAANLVALTITGQAVGGERSQEERAESASAFWSGRIGRNRSLRGNVYIQSRSQARALAEFLRDWHERPRLFFRVSGVVGDPARRLGDRLTLTDADVMTDSRDGYVIGIDWQLGRGGYWQGYELVDAADLYPYDNYHLIGVSHLGAADPQRGRLFY